MCYFHVSVLLARWFLLAKTASKYHMTPETHLIGRNWSTRTVSGETRSYVTIFTIRTIQLTVTTKPSAEKSGPVLA